MIMLLLIAAVAAPLAFLLSGGVAGVGVNHVPMKNT